MTRTDESLLTEIEPDATLRVIGEAGVMRHLRPDPVAPEMVERLIWAATRAASPSNSQLWHFVVVTDGDRRRRIAEVLAAFERRLEALPAPADERDARARRSALNLLRGIADVPVLVFVCGENTYPPGAPDPIYLWATLGGAAQNLLVAARALGLGAALTRFHVVDEAAVASILELPDSVKIGWTIPVGWPARAFGPVRRRPMDQVLHRDRW